jgi:hypothetical protein
MSTKRGVLSGLLLLCILPHAEQFGFSSTVSLALPYFCRTCMHTTVVFCCVGGYGAAWTAQGEMRSERRGTEINDFFRGKENPEVLSEGRRPAVLETRDGDV